MTYLLDTCVVSDFIKGHPAVIKRIRSTEPNDIRISSITVMEIEYGLKLMPSIKKRIGTILSDFIKTITVLPFESEDADFVAGIRVDLKMKGTPIGAYDVLLAGTAVRHQLVFVTSNTEEFKRVGSLVLENWRE